MGGLFGESNDFCTAPQLIQVVGPLLHHFPSFDKVRRAVIGTAQGVLHRMGELVFDEVGPDLEYLVKDRSGHGTETMSGDFRLLKTEAPQTSVDGIFRHAAERGTVAGEYILTYAGKWVK